jgi:hypothetical protein
MSPERHKPVPLKIENAPSIWGPCNIEFLLVRGIPQYKDSDGVIHHAKTGHMFIGVNAKCKKIRDGQYLRPETLLKNTIIVNRDKKGRIYEPCATSIDNEGWAYWLFEMPLEEFPPESTLVTLPQGNA